MSTMAQVTAAIGRAEIESAEWVRDEYGCLNLHVHDENNNYIHCHLQLRPSYCDRGHIQLLIEGPLSLDGADCFPRFFFSFEEADAHTRNFLKWRLWKIRSFPHKLQPPADKEPK